MCFIEPNAQKLEFAAGINRNTFSDGTKENGNPRSTLEPDNGVSIFLSMENLYFDSLPIRIVLAFEKYSGHIHTAVTGFAAENRTDVTTGKYVLGLTLFPLNFSIFHSFDISLGPEINYLLDHTSKGQQERVGYPPIE